MSLNPRLLGHGVQMGTIRWVDVATEPPVTGDPMIYRVGDLLILADAAGIHHPLVVGADGHGIVELTAADSPYEIQETDRVLLVDTTDGPVTALLPEDGGPFLGRPLAAFDAKRMFATNNFTLDGNSHNVGAAATAVLSTTGASIQVAWTDPTWEVASGAGASAPPAQHAPTHEEGGSDPIDGTLALQTLKASASVNLGGGANPGMENNFVKLFAALNSAGSHVGLGFVNENGAIGLIRALTAGGAPNFSLDVITASLNNSATLDYNNQGKGGLMLVALPSATGSQWGIVSFADNAATSLAGQTFTEVTATLTTPNMFNVGASGGQVRFENLTGGARSLIALAILRNPTVA